MGSSELDDLMKTTVDELPDELDINGDDRPDGIHDTREESGDALLELDDEDE